MDTINDPHERSTYFYALCGEYSCCLNPRSTARYLFTMLIVMPALIWPLWQSIQNTSKTLWHKRIIPLALLLFICLLFFQGTVDILGQLNNYQTTIAQQQTLIQFLRQQKMTRFYSDYWTCNHLIFQSQEQLLCATSMTICKRVRIAIFPIERQSGLNHKRSTSSKLTRYRPPC